jgi:predicted RNA-binding Zn ribbon-like protein
VTTPRSTPPATADPRPLLGEPLALDLVNTRWIGPAGREDLLTDTAGLTVWLAGAGLTDTCVADEPTLAALREARDAVVAAVADPADVAGLNAVLNHGRIRRVIVNGVPTEELEIDGPAWRVPWLAADNYARLLLDRPDRIRRCANTGCILHFYDTSKNGTRRWCSMAGCGNRAKAARHYNRARTPKPNQ